MKLKVEENIRFLKKLLFTTPTSKSVAIFERDFSGVVGYVTSEPLFNPPRILRAWEYSIIVFNKPKSQSVRFRIRLTSFFALSSVETDLLGKEGEFYVFRNDRKKHENKRISLLPQHFKIFL